MHSLLDIRNLLSLSAYLTVVFSIGYSIRSRRPQTILSLALLLIPFAPAANVLFPVGTVLAERLLFIPSMGFCMFVADILCVDCKSFWSTLTDAIINQRIAKVKILPISSVVTVLFPVLLIFAVRVVTRNNDWTSEIQIYKSALNVCPTSVKALSNYAMLQLGQPGGIDKTLTYAARALEIHPEQGSALVNTGIAYTRLKRFLLGIHHFQR